MIKLYHGDCLEILPDILDKSVTVITDPPYGIAMKSGGQRFKGSRPIAGDNDTYLAESVAEMCEGIPLAMFFSPFKPLPIKWRSVLVWNKGKHVGIGGNRWTCWKRDFELIGVRDNRPLNGKRDSAVLSFSALIKKPSGNFAEKPISLMVYLIEKLTQPGDIVIDPFMGSGSTGEACVLTGRRFIGIELDSDYFEYAKNRIERVRANLLC